MPKRTRKRKSVVDESKQVKMARVEEAKPLKPLKASISMLKESIALFESERDDEAIDNIRKTMQLLQTSIPQLNKQFCDNQAQTDIPTNINDMPDDCLILIMKHFSLQTQISFRAICHHWKNVVELMCNQKRSLKLFGSLSELKDYVYLYLDDKVHFDFGNTDPFQLDHLKLKPIGYDDDLIIQQNHFHQEFCDFLVELFPNMQQLLVFFRTRSESGFDELPYLLEKWSPTLIKLSLFGYRPISWNCIKDISFPKRMTQAISKLKRLQWLDLKAKHIFKEKKSDAIPIIRRLKHLTIDYKRLPQYFLTSLSKECTSLSFNLSYYGLSRIDRISGVDLALLTTNTILFNSITHLSLACYKRKHLSCLVNYTSVTHLYIDRSHIYIKFKVILIRTFLYIYFNYLHFFIEST